MVDEWEVGAVELKELLGLRELNWTEDVESEVRIEGWEMGEVLDPVVLVDQAKGELLILTAAGSPV